jgi:transcriptional regulator with XRE-family HTH domain
MKLTQHQVAEKLEISQPAVSAFENNNSLDTQLRTFINYAAALGLKINFSIERISWKETD